MQSGFWLSLASSVLLGSSLNAAVFHVVIDPGHGGSDSGAVRGKAREADIALQVGIQLQGFLNQEPGFQASLTRSTDEALTLQERVELAEKAKADLLISIHANAASDRRARGAEFFFQNHLPPDEDSLYMAALENQVGKNLDMGTPELEPTKKNDVLAIIEDLKRQNRMKASHRLSQNLLASWTQKDRTESNSIRQAPFYVVSKTNMPSVLIELGFITNPKEAERLIDPHYQKEIAERILTGIKHYKEIVDKVGAGPLQ